MDSIVAAFQTPLVTLREDERPAMAVHMEATNQSTNQSTADDPPGRTPAVIAYLDAC